MKIICDSCGTKYSISDDKVRGKVFKIRCKKCSHIIVVRGGEAGAEEAAAAPAAEAGGWHIVVEGEQVGPIPDADVRARIERGEIRGDTYIWKEGFADWLKLSAVPEFSDAVAPESGSVNIGDVFSSDSAAPQPTNGTERSGGRRRSGAARPLFGNGGEADVFAAPAAAAAPAGGDLFGSATHSPSESRWPSSGGGGGGGISASGHDGGRVDNLTGQRHENSVLFSLSNLQSLAMPSPKAAVASTGLPPTTEGSGLIDIRAMAANTGTARPADLRGGGSVAEDDLPAFGSFSPAAPVLLPLPSSSGPPKWIYLVILLMVGLVGVVGYLAFKVIMPKQPPAPPPAPPPVAAPAEPAKSAPVAANEPGAKGTAIPDDKLPPREAGDTATATGKDGQDKKDGKDKSPRKTKGSKDKDKKGVAAVDDKKGGAGEKPAGTQIAQPPAPAPGSIDDLLARANKTGGGGGGRPKVADEDKKAGRDEPSAGPLARGAVVGGMNAIKPKVQDCYNQFKVPGMATFNFTIDKKGKVSAATVTGKFAGTPTGACVEKAIKTATFPPSDGLQAAYAFPLK